MKTEKYNVTGMTCAACQANVTRCVQKLEGVEDVNVSLLANQMTVSYDEAQVHPEEIIAAVQKIGYGAALPQATAGSSSAQRKLPMSHSQPKFGWSTAFTSASTRSASCTKKPWFSTIVRTPFSAA